MSAYHELIKNFEKIRAYMRDFYVYGFKSRAEYDKKSVRLYDDERRRMESWLGEHKVFRVILHWLAHNAPDTVCKNLPYIGEYGRFNDLLVLMDTPCEKALLALIRQQLREDIHAMNDGSERYASIAA